MYKLSKELLVMLALSLGIVGCMENRIHFVLPDQYAGAFFLILDEENGTVPEQGSRKITYRLPENGTLLIQSFEPFRELHSLSAEYRSGEKIILATSQTPEDQLALRSLPQFHIGEATSAIAYLIGTKSEEHKVRQKLSYGLLDKVDPRADQ